MASLDHVVYAVDDLERAAETWRRSFGLDSVEGGRHERWGTANRIVPLGDAYVELIAADDPALAAEQRFGRSLIDVAARGGGWLMPVIATDDLEGVAARLDLEIVDGTRRRPDGEVLRWRSAGFDDPRREASMPFFITWDVGPPLHPSAVRAAHGTRATGFAEVVLAGPLHVLEAWVGEERPERLRLVEGAPGIRRVAIATPDRDVVIG